MRWWDNRREPQAKSRYKAPESLVYWSNFLPMNSTHIMITTASATNRGRHSSSSSSLSWRYRHRLRSKEIAHLGVEVQKEHSLQRQKCRRQHRAWGLWLSRMSGSNKYPVYQLARTSVLQSTYILHEMRRAGLFICFSYWLLLQVIWCFGGYTSTIYDPFSVWSICSFIADSWLVSMKYF